eukprot:CAMPEP_0174865324 /NCGR_PEP_ID=MMETSP1114-20130205/60173_1 /TAXON_ID=312471 /ORGANISM="Neobodo designis, Strain CCAP 1951/1" /LENGTH=85 /DNA_ID=CAMNT_0016100451 /DNA_START=17 /DNA_END=271 /DNA_ORIENTATION=-
MTSALGRRLARTLVRGPKHTRFSRVAPSILAGLPMANSLPLTNTPPATDTSTQLVALTADPQMVTLGAPAIPAALYSDFAAIPTA